MTLRRLNWHYWFAGGELCEAIGTLPAAEWSIDAYESVAERVLHGGVKVTRC